MATRWVSRAPARTRPEGARHEPLRASIPQIYQGVADRRQTFRLFDRHAQRPNRFEGDDSALFRGEWFELGKVEHDYM